MSAQIPPRWLVRMLGEFGVKETPGPRSNPRVNEYALATMGGIPPQGDETSWCSSSMCWTFEKSNIRSPRSKAAISWREWGIPLAVPRLGCVAVLHRDDPRNPKAAHVALWLATIADKLILLGGNQGDAVSIAPYAASRLMTFRWPLGEP
jgi:uncharacterized protein (TIGR02594 family)